MGLESSHVVIAPAFSLFVQGGEKAYRKTPYQIPNRPSALSDWAL
jgi:hypothetical protein